MHGHRLLCVIGFLGRRGRRECCASGGGRVHDPWPGLVQDIFNNRPMSDGSDVIAIDMPPAPRTLRSFR